MNLQKDFKYSFFSLLDSRGITDLNSSSSEKHDHFYFCFPNPETNKLHYNCILFVFVQHSFHNCKKGNVLKSLKLF